MKVKKLDINTIKKVLPIVILCAFMLTFLTRFATSSTSAADTGEVLYAHETLNYQLAAGESVNRINQSVFYKQKTANTEVLNLNAGAGKIITKIVLLMDGEVVKTIPVNQQTYNKKISYNGKPIKVISKDNKPVGTWFAWSRGSADAHWTPGTSSHGYTSTPATNSMEKENIGGIIRDKWPGVNVTMTNLWYPRTVDFMSDAYGKIDPPYIDNSKQTLLTANTFVANGNVRINNSENVKISIDELQGLARITDTTTVLKGLKIGKPDESQAGGWDYSLEGASISFTQKYDHLGITYKLPALGAAMMFYFAKYDYDITSYTYRYPNVYEVYVKSGPPSTPPPTSGNPAVDCTEPVPGAPIPGQYLEPHVAAEIRADQRGSEQFDVGQGIPSSESLYGHASAQSYLYKNEFVKMTGTCKYEIIVKKTYTLKWDPTKPEPNPTGGGTHPVPAPTSEPKTVDYTYTITRPYSYWTVDYLAVYGLNHAVLSNDALPGGEITLEPNGYTPPEFSTEITGKYIPPDEPDPIIASPGEKTGGTTRPEPDNDLELLRPLAEAAARKIEVQNDTFVFTGQTIMDGSIVTEAGNPPGTIPAPQPIGDEVLYSPDNVIEPTHVNAANLPSSGEITYVQMEGDVNGDGEDKVYPIPGINSITVHTPVVNYSLLPDDNRPFDQRMVPDMSRTVLILDRPFTVQFTESGQHLNIPGYGNRDYGQYTMNKRIQFPFGVFQGSQYYEENTWIYIPVGTPSMTFTMPTWVNEGNYTIHTESWAINASSDDSSLCEVNMNGNLSHYCASQSFEVGVVGRLFAFRVWDIGDFRFEKVFRTSIGTLDHSPAMYYAGGNDENGNPTAINGQKQWFLPVRKGSHPTEQKTVPHNGYSFLFDFKTIGNMWQKGEGIRIEPSFWFIPKTGGTPAPVDLYYDISGTNNKMVGVSSPKDKESFTRTYRLADGLRNISSGELSTAASYEYNYILSDAERDKTSWLKFYNQYKKRKTKISTGYELEILPYKSRTLIGPTVIPDEVNPITAVRSVQHWYGEYNLPIAPYILPKGTNIVSLANQYGGALDGHEREFITGGYILVKFGIYTVKNGDSLARVLGYKAPIANMWAIEGQPVSDTDELGQTFSFSSGDIILFESDFSVRNDYQGQGR